MEVHTLCTPSHAPLLERFLMPTATESGFNVKTHHAVQLSSSGSYMKDGWTETMRQKAEMLLKVSKENRGEIFIYSDCDIIFNPGNFNPEIARKDFENSAFGAFQDDVVQVCAGFMVLKGSEILEKLLALVLENIEAYKEDQTALNAILKAFPEPATILPQKEYACVRQIKGTLNKENIWNGKPFEVPKHVKIFHANWTHGVESKIALLEFVSGELFEKKHIVPVNAPVVFIVFNRPQLTKQVFKKIREARPKQLFIIADGPRAHKKQDEKLCREARAIVETIDWPCEVRRNYSETNMGCGKRVSSGLDWVFENCEEAIILEDDCVPSADFFLFCEVMLTKYKNDERIMSISGFSAPTEKTQVLRESYYFSKFFGMWGWATWRRTWKSYDFKMEQWPHAKTSGMLAMEFQDIAIVRQWTRDLDNVYANNGTRGIVDTWDFQFAFAHLQRSAFAIKPKTNLVRNIGLGDPEATHTVLPHKLGQVIARPLRWPLIHPDAIAWGKDEDVDIFQAYYKKSEMLFMVKRIIKRMPFAASIVKKIMYRA